MGIVRVYFNQDLRYGIPGLTEILGSAATDARPSDMFMFMNRKRTSLKIIWAGQYLLTMTKRTGGIITLGEIKQIPQVFRGGFMGARLERSLETTLRQSVDVWAEARGLRVS
jgi:hypothetical protein